MSDKGLTVADLRVEIASAAGNPRVPVDGVSFRVSKNECVVLLGESGCGKSLTALALMRLLPEGLSIVGGRAQLDELDLFAQPDKTMAAVRGGRLAMVFQEPQTSLNPVLTIGQQIAESLFGHQQLKGAAAQAEAGRLLSAVDKFSTSWRLMYDFHTENSDAFGGRDVAPGQAFHFNYSFEYQFLKNFWGSVAGYYLVQTTDDEINGQKQSDSMEQVFAIGPAFVWAVSPNFSMGLKTAWEMATENRPEGNRTTFRMTYKF